MSDLKEKQLDLWQGFVDYIDDTNICNHTVLARNSYTLRLAPGAGLRIALKISKDSIRYRVYFPDKKIKLFKFLKEIYKDDIEKGLGTDIKWLPTDKGNEIVKTISVHDVYNKENYPEHYKWFKSQALLVMKILPQYIERYKAEQE